MSFAGDWAGLRCEVGQRRSYRGGSGSQSAKT
jgi:hypothetical protein